VRQRAGLITIGQAAITRRCTGQAGERGVEAVEKLLKYGLFNE